MSEPRLTIGIPTLDRAAFLEKCIGKCLDQYVPVRVIVADQGHTREVAAVMRRYADRPEVEHVLSPATTLLDNWRFAAKTAMDRGAEFFAWCQDDDIIARGYSRKILYGFDRFKNAVVWLARLMCANSEYLARPDIGNGPPISMNVLDGEPCSGPGLILTPGQFCASWALSPAVAFRCGDAFREALDRMPEGCDLFNERTILAAIGQKGDAIMDPIVAGYWVIHEGCEHRRQNISGDGDRQKKIFLEWLDGLMDEAGETAIKYFRRWSEMCPFHYLKAWIDTASDPIYEASRYSPQLKEIMIDALKSQIPLPSDMTQSQDISELNGHPTTAGDIVTLVNSRMRIEEMVKGEYDPEEIEQIRERMDPCWRRLAEKELNPDRLIGEIIADIRASKAEAVK